MPRNNCSSPLFASALVLVVISIPAVSRAQTCASDVDCAAGLTCQVSAVAPQPTVDPACVKGQTCAGPAPQEKVSRPVPVQTSTCQVAPCKVDSDCAAGMVCHTEKYASCSGGSSVPPCAPNTACDVSPKPTPPDSCVATTTSTCAFKWQLPCNTDQDCGNDFVCAPTVSGTCSSGSGVAGGGSTGAVGGSGTAPPVASDPTTGSLVAPRDSDGGARSSSDGGTTCTTATSFPGYCQPKAITCVVDADCPLSWTCAAPPMTATQGAPPVAGASTDSNAPGAGALVPVGPKLCLPVHRGGGGIAIDVGSGSTGTGNDAGGQSPMLGKASSENASGSGGAGCAVAGARGSAGVPLLGSVLLGLLVSGMLRIRRRTARRNP
ncbi:MAG: hypothetical protein ABJA82_09915 [Myxococcales bacterium]